MKVTQHVEHLLRQGKKPEELVELGFPKQVVTMVRRQLREEKAAQRVKPAKGATKGLRETAADTGDSSGAMEQKVASLEQGLQVLDSRVDALTERLDNTPTADMRYRFKCDGCGSEGLLATRIRCTKCGREVWWGWFPNR